MADIGDTVNEVLANAFNIYQNTKSAILQIDYGQVVQSLYNGFLWFITSPVRAIGIAGFYAINKLIGIGTIEYVDHDKSLQTGRTVIEPKPTRGDYLTLAVGLPLAALLVFYGSEAIKEIATCHSLASDANSSTGLDYRILMKNCFTNYNALVHP